MPKAIKQSPDKKPVGKKPETEEAKRRRKKNNTTIIVTAILAVIAIAISVGYYVIYKMPVQRPIIKVNNETVKVSYLLKRCLLSSSDDIDSMITNIVYELVIEQAAPEYGIVVTEADIDQALKDGAKGTNESITDAEFQEWYRQELRTSQFSDKEFREVIRTGIIVQRLQTYLQNSLPTTAAQVYLHYLYVSDYDTAATIKQRIDAGEDFATIARELSLDENAKEDGGDKGWIPVHA
ncbi:MAG: SurA N-terminal domain-containing protein, partial [Chloroflexi bacterium]|nr:SurA N-terminal domain-containing protein [Chloroflexota bacterium]